MGTRERRQREYEERELAFLDSARTLIREEGLLNLQMARVAEKCEYAVGTLYKHFESKEDLLVALTLQDTRQQVEMFERVRCWDADSRARMFAVGVADMIFVRRHPDYFRLTQYVFCEVVWQAATADRRQELLEAMRPLNDAVTAIVDDAVAAGDLTVPFPAHEIITGFWGLSIGTHSLAHAEGALEQLGAPNPYRLMCRHVQAMLNGYGWKPLQDVADDEALDRLIQRICNEVFHDLCTGK